MQTTHLHSSSVFPMVIHLPHRAAQPGQQRVRSRSARRCAGAAQPFARATQKALLAAPYRAEKTLVQACVGRRGCKGGAGTLGGSGQSRTDYAEASALEAGSKEGREPSS
jgi:hypothetical protein